MRGSEMVGIRFHGRGGQGAVIASKILANAYFKQGFYVQAFPSFGMERKGAAVSAFVRLDDEPIVERGEIQQPTSVIVLDASLLQKVDIARGAKQGALILVNCKNPDDWIDPTGDFRVAGVDAGKIAYRYGLGSKTAPIINTVILGAYARLCTDLKLSYLLEAIEAYVPANPKQNISAAEAAYNAVFGISGEVDAS
jgi:2-oxoacid:acceptor oxidoreductase gamma subunit (pyruvate/2-ketoisovalerate family)